MRIAAEVAAEIAIVNERGKEIERETEIETEKEKEIGKQDASMVLLLWVIQDYVVDLQELDGEYLFFIMIFLKILLI